MIAKKQNRNNVGDEDGIKKRAPRKSAIVLAGTSQVGKIVSSCLFKSVFPAAFLKSFAKKKYHVAQSCTFAFVYVLCALRLVILSHVPPSPF